jgi:hypothetical protein
LFTGKRILVRRIVGEKLIVAPTDKILVADQLLHTVKPRSELPDYRFIAAVLASRAAAYYFRKRFNRTEKTFPEIRVAELAALPIPQIDLKNPTDRDRHDRVVELVDRMLELHKELAAVKTADDKTRIQRQIDVTGGWIDKLVYELYGLTADEIKIVEGTAK